MAKLPKPKDEKSAVTELQRLKLRDKVRQQRWRDRHRKKRKTDEQ